MDKKHKTNKIIQFLKEFKIVFALSTILIIIYSLNEFGIFPEGFPVLALDPKDIIGATIALIGVYIAFEGLSNWNNQIKGKHNYDLAFTAILLINEVKPLIKKISQRKINQQVLYDPETMKIMDENLDVIFSPFTIIYSYKYQENIDDLKELRKKLIELKKKIDVFWKKEIGESLQEVIDFCFFFEIGLHDILQYIMRDRDVTIKLEGMSEAEMNRHKGQLFKYINYSIAYKRENGYEVLKYYEETNKKLTLVIDNCIKLFKTIIPSV